MKKFLEAIKNKKIIIAMLHLYGKTTEDVMKNAKYEIETLYKNGVDAILVENYFSYNEPQEVSLNNCMRALNYLQQNYPERLYGVNFLYDFDNPAVETARQNGSVFAEKISFALAHEYGACFVQAESAAGHVLPECDERFGNEINKLREMYPNITLVAGVRFKYQPELSGNTLKDDLILGRDRCDVVVVSGDGTGMETSMDKLRTFKEIYPEGLFVIGSGLNMQNAGEQFRESNGGIVGTCLKKDGIVENSIDENSVKAFVAISKGISV